MYGICLDLGLSTDYMTARNWDAVPLLQLHYFWLGSFRVRSTNFLLNLRDPPPISMKFGTLADNVWKKICANFQRCRSSGFRDMTFQKMEKGSIFSTRPVSKMSITCVLLEVGSSMIALSKALIWLYNSYLTNYNKSQKPESYIFW